MKVCNTCITLLAILFMYACSEEISFNSKSELSSVVIYVPLENDSSPTYSPDESDIYIEKNNIYSFLINFTNQRGDILLSKTINREPTKESDWNYLTSLSKGLKIHNLPKDVHKIFIYGNPGNALKENLIVTRLADQQGDAILYYGEIDVQSSISEKNYPTEVALTPLISQLRINSLSFINKSEIIYSSPINKEFEETTRISWDHFDGTVKGIYMNNFYNNYNQDHPENLLSNKTFNQHIHNGQWIFSNPQVNATKFASYSNYYNGEYAELSLKENEEYHFNFFPGDQLPYIHIDLVNVQLENLVSENKKIYDPTVVVNKRFATIQKYINNGEREMTANDFTAGKVYNMNIELIPVLTTDLDMQYEIEAIIEILPLAEKKIIMIFQ